MWSLCHKFFSSRASSVQSQLFASGVQPLRFWQFWVLLGSISGQGRSESRSYAASFVRQVLYWGASPISPWLFSTVTLRDGYHYILFKIRKQRCWHLLGVTQLGWSQLWLTCSLPNMKTAVEKQDLVLASLSCSGLSTDLFGCLPLYGPASSYLLVIASAAPLSV